MTTRPAWLIDRIADLVLERNRYRDALAQVRVIADNPLTDPAAREALTRALRPVADIAAPDEQVEM